MNKIYKIIWSKAKNCFVVASELAKNHTKSPRNAVVGSEFEDNIMLSLCNSAVCSPVFSTGFIQPVKVNQVGSLPNVENYDFKITVAAIVKNEAKNVPTWVKAARSCADEIVVVDTGSTDGTVERFAEYGIECYHYEWQDDFAAAKNYMISLCHGDWIVLLDGDEWFREDCNVRKAIAKHHGNPIVKAIISDWICLDTTRNNTIMFSGGAVRAFRNQPDVRYFRKVHENLTINYENFVFEPELKLYHTGYSGDVNRSKHERNLRIMRTMFDFDNGKVEFPTDWRYVQDTYAGLGDFEKSLWASDKMLEFNVPDYSAASWITRFNVLFAMKTDIERMKKEFEYCFKTVPTVSGFRFLAAIYYIRHNMVPEGLNQYIEGMRMLTGPQDKVAMEHSYWRMYMPEASALVSAVYLRNQKYEAALYACKVCEAYCGKTNWTNMAFADIYRVLPSFYGISTFDIRSNFLNLFNTAKKGILAAALISTLVVGMAQPVPAYADNIDITTPDNSEPNIVTNAICSIAIGSCNTVVGEGNFVFGVCNDLSGSGISLDSQVANVTLIGTANKLVYPQTPHSTSAIGIGNWSWVGPGSVAIGSFVNNTDEVTIDGAEDGVVGENTVAIGSNALTQGDMSVAVGNATLAKSEKSVSLGTAAHALGLRSIAIGACSQVDADYSVVIGENAWVEGYCSVGVGAGVHISGECSVAVGDNSVAYEEAVAIGNHAAAFSGSVSIGRSSYTDASNSVSLGINSVVEESSGTALGSCAYVNAENSVALGADSAVSCNNTVSVGHLASDVDQTGVAFGSDMTRRIVNVSDGAAVHDASTVGQTGSSLSLSGSTLSLKTATGATLNSVTLPSDSSSGSSDIHLYAGNGAACNAHASNGQMKLTVADGTTVKDSVLIKGVDHIEVFSDNNGNVTILKTPGGLIGGQNGVASGDYSTVSGGWCNTASADSSSVSGGVCNEASADDSSISGGSRNIAAGCASSISGGECNYTTGYGSSVSGGCCNTASGCYSFVGGGECNTASGDVSTVVGGLYNVSDSYYSLVAGGSGNTANSHSSTVVGGASNTASGETSLVVGGFCNNADGVDSVAVGGCNGVAYANFSTVIGGGIAGNASCVLAAQHSVAIGHGAVTTKDYEVTVGSSCAPVTIGGNLSVNGTNTVSDGTTTVNWSDLLSAAGGGSTSVLPGCNNTVSGCYAYISGGCGNITSGCVSSISGGQNNVAGCYYSYENDQYRVSFVSPTCSDVTFNSDYTQVTVGNKTYNLTSYSGDSSSVLGGSNNLAVGVNSAVGGGHCNVASGNDSFTAGGSCNIASACYSTAVGGIDNESRGLNSAVIGGCHNTAGQYYSYLDVANDIVMISPHSTDYIFNNNDTVTIPGVGTRPLISYNGNYAVVLGGGDNVAAGDYSSVSGGRQNYAYEEFAHVSGGFYNHASGCYSAILGGDSNFASGCISTVVGGCQNNASGYYATVSGGTGNKASGEASYVAGGGGNEASGNFSTVIGSYESTVTGTAALILGGETNSASGFVSTAIGGCINSASGCYSTVMGGCLNAACAKQSTAVGGVCNIASGCSATAVGGTCNTAGVYYSYTTTSGNTVYVSPSCTAISNDKTTITVGSKTYSLTKYNGDYASVFGGQDNKAIGNYSVASAGCQNMAVGEYSSALAGKLNVALGCYSSVTAGEGNLAYAVNSSVSGGSCNTAGGETSSVSGGVYNRASGVASSVSGGICNVASGCYASVLGGEENEAQGGNSSVTAGLANMAFGDYSSVTGGAANQASCSFASISAGGENLATGYGSSISGGYANTSSGCFTSVTSGRCNVASGCYASVSGGHSNIAGTYYSYEDNEGWVEYISPTCSAISTDKTTITVGSCTYNLKSYQGAYSSVSGGSNNLAIGDLSSVTAGCGNIASGCYSSIVGGECNTASGDYSFVTGGCTNIASGKYSSIVAGMYNIASGEGSSVSGGHTNSATDGFSSVSGGKDNLASCAYASVSGGWCNTASGTVSSVSGGFCNVASCFYSSVSGGQENTASAMLASVSGGRCNVASYGYSSVSGGTCNTASACYSSVSGGCDNHASGVASSVSGGICNTAAGCYTTVVGGKSNRAGEYLSYKAADNRIHFVSPSDPNVSDGKYNDNGWSFDLTAYNGGNNAAVFGGLTNVAAGQNAVVVGGECDYAVGDMSVVLGGYNNLASGNGSSIIGGSSNSATCYGSSISGGYCGLAACDYASISGGYRGIASGYASSVTGGYDNKAVDSYASVTGGNCNVAAAIYSFVSGGRQNVATCMYASAIGGICNYASYDYSVAIGGCCNNSAYISTVVVGGSNNRADGNTSLVAGGFNNISGGFYSTVVGGCFGYAYADASTAIGGGITGDTEDSSTAYGSVAIGKCAVTTRDYEVAIGSQCAPVMIGGDLTVTSKIHGVTAGTADTDAVNVGQMNQALADLGISELDALAIKYDSNTKERATFGGAQGTVLGNLKAGAISATSMEAVNGSQLYAVKQDIAGFATDIARNSENIRTMNASVTSALSSVAASGLLVDTMDATKADSSLNNLTDSGKRVLKQYAETAVQEYMAAQQGSNSAPIAPMAYSITNSNTLTVTNAGNGSLHVGEGSYVNGTSSIAIGVGNQVNANNSGAFGDPSIINADESYVLGNDDTINSGATSSFIVGNDGVSDAKGGLLFGSNTKATVEAEDGIALGNRAEVSAKNSIALGSGSIADTENTVSVGNDTLKRRITNVAEGNITEDSTDVVTGSQLFVTNEKVQQNTEAIEKKADANASNIDVKEWATKLGVGKVENGNTDLVTGGDVYDAMKDIKTASDFVKESNGIISIAPNSTATKINIGNSSGEGRVITGVVTDVNDVSSAANVGYVNSVATNVANEVNRGFNKMNDRIDKVGAGAAAMAGLVPGPMDGDEKWSISAAVGNYRSATAGAVGAFYKPTDNVMVAVKGSFGSDENMVSGGVGISLNKGNVPGVSKAQMVRTINAQAGQIQQQANEIQNMKVAHQAEISNLQAQISALAAKVNEMQK